MAAGRVTHSVSVLRKSRRAEIQDSSKRQEQQVDCALHRNLPDGLQPLTHKSGGLTQGALNREDTFQSNRRRYYVPEGSLASEPSGGRTTTSTVVKSRLHSKSLRYVPLAGLGLFAEIKSPSASSRRRGFMGSAKLTSLLLVVNRSRFELFACGTRPLHMCRSCFAISRYNDPAGDRNFVPFLD